MDTTRRTLVKGLGALGTLAGMGVHFSLIAEAASQASSVVTEPGVESRLVKSTCAHCVNFCGISVKIENNVIRAIYPDEGRAEYYNHGICPKGVSGVFNTYNPYRLKTPLKRTNPRKGRHEDPGFVSISWDEALDTISERLANIRKKGLIDDAGLPRVAATFGMGGTPVSYMGTFPAFLSAWGPIDFSIGSGQGVKCVHAEHLYGEDWHRAFIVCADTPISSA